MLNIDRPEETKRSVDKSSDYVEEQMLRKQLRLHKEHEQKKKEAKFDRIAGQIKADEMKRVIKQLENELQDYDIDKVSEDDPFVQEQMEEMRVKAGRWKISDKNWMGIVGAIGSGQLYFRLVSGHTISMFWAYRVLDHDGEQRVCNHARS